MDEKTEGHEPETIRAPSPENGSIETGKVVDNRADEALKFLNAHAGASFEIDEATDKMIRRKIDVHLLPWMCMLYLLQYLDKTALSYASSMNIKGDTHMNASQYSWAGSIFYVGYLVFEYPHNRLMQRFPVGKYLSLSVVIWGCVLAATAGCTTAGGVLAVRFFLGAMEGSVTAGFVLITSQWYRTREQTFRTAIWFSFNGVAQICGGAIAYGVARGFRENTAITLAPWRFLFLITGCATAAFGVLMWFFLADSPITAKWLNDDERLIAIERLRANQQGVGSRVFKWYQVKEALTDIRTYIIFLLMVTANIPNGGVTVYFTQLIGSYGFSKEDTFLIAMPGGVAQLLTNLPIPYIAGRLGHRYLGAAFGMLVGLFGISLMAGLAMHDPLHAKIGQLVGYYIVIGNSATVLILILGTIASNTAGHTKKTTVNAITLIAYCVGFLIGPQTFRDGPYYYAAKYNIIAQWFVTFCCCVALYFINKRENQRRDRLAIEENLPAQPAGQEFLDLTDKENRYFRYAL